MTCDANLSTLKEIVDVYSAQGRLPPDQARYDLEFFQDPTLSSTSLMKIRWPPPPSIAMVHRLPLTLSPLLVSPPSLQHLDLLA